VEPSRTLFELAEKSLGGSASLFHSTFERAHLPREFFDAISMWDVLEHVRDPITFLAAAASLLKSQGYLALNVPNLDSLPARLLGRSWPLVLPEHLNYFNKKSLRLAVQKAGMRLVCFGTRPAAFSLCYIAHRLQQHGIRLAKNLEAVVVKSVVGKCVIPVYMGEVYAVIFKP
jgi:hypothetical protein